MPLSTAHWSVNNWTIIFYGSTALVCSRLLCEVPRSHSDIPHSVGLLWTSDRPLAESSTWQHATIRREKKTYMPPAGFEPAISASERPKTHPLDWAATGISCWLNISGTNVSATTWRTGEGEEKKKVDSNIHHRHATGRFAVVHFLQFTSKCPALKRVTHRAPAVRVMLSNANSGTEMNGNQKCSYLHVTLHSPKMGLCKWLGQVLCKLKC